MDMLDTDVDTRRRQLEDKVRRAKPNTAWIVVASPREQARGVLLEVRALQTPHGVKPVYFYAFPRAQ